MTDPLVSVVLPVYRAADDLREAVERLQSQTRVAETEIIVVDDGSDDGTAELARELAGRFAGVRAIVLDRNGGVASARRRGVEDALGEYLWFVDADDAWPDDALSVLLEAAVRDSADVVIADAEFVHRDGHRRTLRAPSSSPVGGRSAFRMLLRGEVSGHLWNKLFRRSTMAAASFAPARVQSDLVMVAEALAKSRRVTFVSAVVYEYRLRPGSIIGSVSRRADSLEIIDVAMRRAADGLGLSASDDYRYFRARYILLSAIKDATLADYESHERHTLLRSRRRELSLSDIALFVRRADVRRAVLAASAKYEAFTYRKLLTLADR